MTKEFWSAALIRAVRTICQTAIATITVNAAVVMSDVNWSMVVSASILSGIISLLTSIATGLPEVDDLVMYEEDVEYEDGDEDE